MSGAPAGLSRTAQRRSSHLRCALAKIGTRTRLAGISLSAYKDQPARYRRRSARFASSLLTTLQATGSNSRGRPTKVATLPRRSNSITGPE